MRYYVLAALPALLFATTVQTADFTETKVTASDAAKGDLFGWSVAMSGPTAIVGAMWDDKKQGAAYVYDTSTGAQITKLVASNAVDDGRFGKSVAISGTAAIVGASGWDADVTVPGAAYLFDTTTWAQTAKLTVGDDGTAAEDISISSVGISGSTVIVGAYINTGVAYLFDTSSGAQTSQLIAKDVVDGDNFGRAVAIFDTTAIVGATDVNNGRGAAYLFDTTTGAQIAKLTASDAAANQSFGFAVAISGTTAIVGAFGNADQGHFTGAAYLFHTKTGKQIAKLTASDAVQGDMFGFTVAISGNTAIVGANQTADDKGLKRNGEAFLFDATTGAQIAKLTASDGEINDRFGNSVAISGTTAIVGANASHDNGKASGSAYIFHLK